MQTTDFELGRSKNAYVLIQLLIIQDPPPKTENSP